MTNIQLYTKLNLDGEDHQVYIGNLDLLRAGLEGLLSESEKRDISRLEVRRFDPAYIDRKNEKIVYHVDSLLLKNNSNPYRKCFHNLNLEGFIFDREVVCNNDISIKLNLLDEISFYLSEGK